MNEVNRASSWLSQTDVPSTSGSQGVERSSGPIFGAQCGEGTHTESHIGAWFLGSDP